MSRDRLLRAHRGGQQRQEPRRGTDEQGMLHFGGVSSSSMITSTAVPAGGVTFEYTSHIWLSSFPGRGLFISADESRTSAAIEPSTCARNLPPYISEPLYT